MLIAFSAIAGGLAARFVPPGHVRLIVASGEARLSPGGSGGTFRADGGPVARIPEQVAWTDRTGRRHPPGRPACLWNDTAAPPNPAVRLEAGYRWIDFPGGDSELLVMWVECR